MGNRLHAGNLSHRVTSYSNQLSLANPSRGTQMTTGDSRVLRRGRNDEFYVM